MSEQINNQQESPSTATSGKELATPEQINKIKRDFLDVTTKNSALNSLILINKRKLLDIKKNLVTEVLTEMQNNGVDLNDQNSVDDFLAKLEQKNPDFLELFQLGFQGLTDGLGINNNNENNNENSIQTNQSEGNAQPNTTASAVPGVSQAI
jgi:hypothetical protein